MRFPLDLPPGEKCERFLDYFNAILRTRVSHGCGSAGRSEGGAYVTDFRGPFSLGTSEVTLTWTLVTTPDGGLQHLEVHPDEGTSVGEDLWRSDVSAFVAAVLSKTLGDRRERLFQRCIFHYVGEHLDGEYWLPGFRFAPVDPSDSNPALRNAERVVALDMNIEAIDLHDARDVARERSRRQAARLSLLLNVGLYEPRQIHTWVLPGETASSIAKDTSVRLLATYNRAGLYPQAMPTKGTACHAGLFQGSLASPYRLTDQLSLPPEARRIFRAIEAARPELRDAFDGASRLYQAACILGPHYPSAGLAYRVAAVEAASHADSGTGNFSAFVRKYATPNETMDAALDYLYGSVRSAHLHSGKFPLGEFERSPSFALLMDPVAQEKQAFHSQCSQLVREAIVKWIMSLLPASGEPTAADA